MPTGCGCVCGEGSWEGDAEQLAEQPPSLQCLAWRGGALHWHVQPSARAAPRTQRTRCGWVCWWGVSWTVVARCWAAPGAPLLLTRPRRSRRAHPAVPAPGGCRDGSAGRVRHRLPAPSLTGLRHCALLSRLPVIYTTHVWIGQHARCFAASSPPVVRGGSADLLVAQVRATDLVVSGFKAGQLERLRRKQGWREPKGALVCSRDVRLPRRRDWSYSKAHPFPAGPLLYMATYYETLGVSANATEEQIKAAFRGKALENHPDLYVHTRLAHFSKP